jgi:putative endonuclease
MPSIRRLSEHRPGLGSGFVKKHGVTRLVHVERYDAPSSAIAREKQLKHWNRDWKVALIEERNPDGLDLTPDLN